MPFGMWPWVGLRNYVLERGPDPQMRRGNFENEKGLAQDMPGSQYTQSN